MRTLLVSFGIVALVAAVVAVPRPASGAFPGANGRIVFATDDGTNESYIVSILPDGSDLQVLTAADEGPSDDGELEPRWSPGGTLIAFTRQTVPGDVGRSDVWIMNANGSGEKRLTGPDGGWEPSFSADGARIVFVSSPVDEEVGDEVYTMSLTGGDIKRLTNHPAHDFSPAWSPDNTRIAFSSNRRGIPEIFTMNADGTGVTRKTTADVSDTHPVWSSDGAWIYYTHEELVDDQYQLGIRRINVATNATQTIVPGHFFGSSSPAPAPDTGGLSYLIVYRQYGYGLTIADPNATTHILPSDTNAYFPDWQPIPAFPLVDARFSSFEADIVWAYGAGITTGCSAERYCVNDPVTRGQMATFLARALNLPEAQFDYFDDDDGTTHEENTNRIFEAGITTGCGPGAYCPDGLVTREQMASFLARAFNLPATATDYFSDDETSSHEANINRIRAAGITTGCSATTYCPKGHVTRGQMAAFLHRAVE